MDIHSSQFWKCIGTAILCGAIIGFERQLRGKPAGIRTSILICLGTALFISLGVEFTNDNSDMTRVLGQVVTGIGFLGAGVILSREGIVLGVTSAAVVWVLAATGALIGFKKYPEAMVVTLITVALLSGITFLETRMKSLRQGVHAPLEKHKKHQK